MTLDAAVLRQTFGRFPSGVTAVCAKVDGELTGIAASSFTSVSLDPPLVSVCIASVSTTWPLLRNAAKIGVSILGARHDAVCRQLAAKSSAERFTGVPVSVTDDDAVVIDGAAAWFECSLDDEVQAGDHVIAILRVHDLKSAPDVQPLVFHASSFHELRPVEKEVL